jgi:hypothetical protein
MLMVSDIDDVRTAYIGVFAIAARVARRAAEMNDPNIMESMDDAIGVLAARAHDSGVSWEGVGDALGMSATAAYRRFCA